MEIIGQVSRGSNMDQIYLSKNRIGFLPGENVIISSLSEKFKRKQFFKPYFYGISKLEPLKLEIIKEIFEIIEGLNPENIIITGSFLDKGFKFNDIDILVIKEGKVDSKKIQDKIEEFTQINTHIIPLNSKALSAGLSTDPLYSLMISRCVSKKRLSFKIKRTPDYKLLDYQLLKSEILPDSFDFLKGDEKYYLTRNMLAILLFIQNKKLSKQIVDTSIEKIFNVKIKEIQENIIEKETFSKKYKETYNRIFKLLLRRIHESK